MTIHHLLKDLLDHRHPLAVIGLGYVGLPLAVCLAKRFRVIGFDVDARKISVLRSGQDPNGEVERDRIYQVASKLEFTDRADDLRKARFIIVAVPTPVDDAKRPDFGPLISASLTVARNLNMGSIVVFESTVYPGATEEICIPAIEKESTMKAGRDFTFGYSPERINPGDKEHTIERVRKVVSGSDAETLEIIAGVYGAVINAGVYRAAGIKIAEAAKVIENTQRDLNIALINELALIFHRLNIDTMEVLEAAGTKWNFLPFRPGLVGGHCIGVDPYYLTHKAEEVGYHPHVILAGRRINDGIGQFIAQECVRLMIEAGRPVKFSKVIILGLTFKENCSDVRNTRVMDIVAELRRFGADPAIVDPMADAESAYNEYGLELISPESLPKCHAIIAAVSHSVFHGIPIEALAASAGSGAPFLDVKSFWDRAMLQKHGLTVWRL